jgi:hypothetical protein
MNKKIATLLVSLFGLLSTGVHSAANDFNGLGGACVANGYGYCPSTNVCFEDQSLPTPNPTAATKGVALADSKAKLGCLTNPNFTTNSTTKEQF